MGRDPEDRPSLGISATELRHVAQIAALCEIRLLDLFALTTPTDRSTGRNCGTSRAPTTASSRRSYTFPAGRVRGHKARRRRRDADSGERPMSSRACVVHGRPDDPPATGCPTPRYSSDRHRRHVAHAAATRHRAYARRAPKTPEKRPTPPPCPRPTRRACRPSRARPSTDAVRHNGRRARAAAAA